MKLLTKLYVSPLISHLSMNKSWVCICWINFHGGVKSEMVVNIHDNVIIISHLSLSGYERFIYQSVYTNPSRNIYKQKLRLLPIRVGQKRVTREDT